MSDHRHKPTPEQLAKFLAASRAWHEDPANKAVISFRMKKRNKDSKALIRAREAARKK